MAMKTFTTDSNYIIKLDDIGLRIEEYDKRKGRPSLFLLTYLFRVQTRQLEFKLTYRHQTVPEWYKNLNEVKERLEEYFGFQFPERPFEIFEAQVLAKKMLADS